MGAALCKRRRESEATKWLQVLGAEMDNSPHKEALSKLRNNFGRGWRDLKFIKGEEVPASVECKWAWLCRYKLASYQHTERRKLLEYLKMYVLAKGEKTEERAL